MGKESRGLKKKVEASERGREKISEKERDYSRISEVLSGQCVSGSAQ